MGSSSVRRYFQLLRDRRSIYLRFNKQLLIGELAGFAAGIAAAEVAASASVDDFSISAYSSASDYIASILGFFAVYYSDNRSTYKEQTRCARIKKVTKDAFKLWPSVVAADVAFIIVRPYLHYMTLLLGLEAGLAAAIAHFLAFGVFNCVALFSKSMIDYARTER
jgi:hypothetical protein